MKKKVIIGSRGSALALWQTNYVASLLGERFGVETEIVKIKTTGDKILDSALSAIGSKGLFVKEIEIALQKGEIDMAVHSAKDVPTEIPEGLVIAAFLEREDPRDALISRNGNYLTNLPSNSVVATSSLRRRAQLLHFRSDLRLTDVRGNVDTRLRKMNEGQFDAIILAKAGLKRLGRESDITEVISTDHLLPAVGQGSIAIECRGDDGVIRQMVESLAHFNTMAAVRAERALMRALEGGCQVPIGALGKVVDGKLRLEALVASVDGREYVRDTFEGGVDEPEEVGIELAQKLLGQGADSILAEIRSLAKGYLSDES